MPKIFICYRRNDSPYVTGQIRDNAAERFGPESVVLDIDSVPLGRDFRQYVKDEVGKCDILLAVIGKQWLAILNERNDPDDLIRVEILAALTRGIPVVPVLVDGASVPKAEELPTELVPLAYRHAAEVRAGLDVKVDLERLMDGLNDHLSADLPQGTGHKDLPPPPGSPPQWDLPPGLPPDSFPPLPPPPGLSHPRPRRLAVILSVIAGLIAVTWIVSSIVNGGDEQPEIPPEATTSPSINLIESYNRIWCLRD